MLTSPSLLRLLAWLVAITLALATLLSLALGFDLVATRPSFPDTSTLVDRLLGTEAFRHALWPVELATNLLFAVAFAAAVPFAGLLGDRVPQNDERRRLFVGLLAGGAIVGLVGAVAYIGARGVTNDIAYCDCGFKEQETISQAWAMMLANGSRVWLLNIAAVVVAIAIGIAGRTLARANADGDAATMPASWGTLSLITMAALGLSALATLLRVGDPVTSLVSAVATGILVPVWGIWLGQVLGRSGRTIERA